MQDQRRLFGLWNWLPAFHVVARTQHLPTASRQLHVSVSALSRTIKQLEGAVGHPLFRRVGRGLELTERGRALRDALDRKVDALGAELQRIAAGDGATVVRVAVAHGVSQRAVVPTVLAALAQPGVVPSLHGCDDAEAMELVVSGEVELALVSSAAPSPKLRIDRLGELQRGVYCGAGHALFDAARVALDGHAFVAQRDDEPTPGAVAVFVNQEDSALELCLQGSLLAVLPDAVAQPFVTRRQLRRLGDAGGTHRPLWAARRREGASPLVQPVIDALLARASVSSAEPPSRWRLGDELLVRAEHDAAVAAWGRAAKASPLRADERVEWSLRLARAAILRGRWSELAARQSPRGRGWSVEARAELAALVALADCLRGRLDGAERSLQTARALLERADSQPARRAWIAVHRASGNLHAAAGRPEDAVVEYEAAESLSVAAGDRWERSIALYNLGEAHLLRGDLPRAAALLERAAGEKLELGDRWGRAWVHHGRSFIQLRSRRPEQAVREAAAGLTLAVDVGDGKPAAMLHLLIGRAQLALGDGREAERAFRFAARAAEQARAQPERLQAQLGIVDVRLRAGELAGAAAELARARPLARLAGSPHGEAALLVAVATVEERRGRKQLAERRRTDAAQLVPTPLDPYGYWFNVGA
jgi:DNA-binding transcriptional LysR family regulator/tetratricopeptide (TPR) repeat protein